MQTKELIKKIEELEIKANIYTERLGPKDEIVKGIDQEIAKLNTKLLDLMVLEQRLSVIEGTI